MTERHPDNPNNSNGHGKREERPVIHPDPAIHAHRDSRTVSVAIVTGLYAPLRNPAMWERLMEKDILFRFLYVILIGGLAFLFPVGKVKDENKKWVYTSMTLVTASMLVVGFSRLSAWYNLFVFPILFVAYTLLVIKTLPYFIRRHAQSDDSIFGLSREESAFYFRFETASGPLVIHKPQQNVYIDGGPGSGKSESWIKGIIYQCAERNYAGFVYDWEGDPTKTSPPSSHVSHTEASNISGTRGWKHPVSPISTLWICHARSG